MDMPPRKSCRSLHLPIPVEELKIMSMKPAAMIRPDALVDSRGRVMRDLRVSVTDRCNFRCLYCLPESEAAQEFYRDRRTSLVRPRSTTQRWQPKEDILHFEEIERVARLGAGLGMEKIRLTGGEPLLRQELEKLVARLARIPGIRDLAMTTNGFLFLEKGKALRDAGLRRVSFSLDSLDRENFKRMTGWDALEEVLASIQSAQELGLHPVKVNAVIVRGLNDSEIEVLAEFGHARDLSLRFIEFMPLDSARGWREDRVVPGWEILGRLQARYRLRPVAPVHPSETAQRWAFPDGRGEIGIIASVSAPFCGQCNRIRMTADGKVRTCLFSAVEHDLRTRLREGASDQTICAWLQEVVWHKEAQHRIGESDFIAPARAMSCIGG
jgi:cyclic pyranopterin phosphate synthase